MQQKKKCNKYNLLSPDTLLSIFNVKCYQRKEDK